MPSFCISNDYSDTKNDGASTTLDLSFGVTEALNAVLDLANALVVHLERDLSDLDLFSCSSGIQLHISKSSRDSLSKL